MSDLPEFDEEDQIIGWLEEQGALIWDGVAEDGEPMFRFDLEVLKVVMPPLYESIIKEMDDDLMQLYQEGLIEIEYNENLEALFKLSEKGKQISKLLGFPFLD